MRFGAVSLRVLSIRAPARHVPCTTVWRSVLTLFARLGRSIEEQPWSHEPADARLSHCGRVRGPDCEGEVWTGKLEWLGETRRTIKDAVMAAASNGPETTATSEAADWLVDYLTLQSGSADSALIKAEGRTAGHCGAALHRARKKLEITATSSGFPRKTFRCLPASRFTSSRVTASGESAMNEMTTASQGSQSSSRCSRCSRFGPHASVKRLTRLAAKGTTSVSATTCGRATPGANRDRVFMRE
jgi:hypothetical protein